MFHSRVSLTITTILFLCSSCVVFAQISDAEYEEANAAYNKTQTQIRQLTVSMQEASDQDEYNKLKEQYDKLTTELEKYAKIRVEYQREHKELTDVKKIFNEGNRFLKLRRYDEALAEFQNCIEMADEVNSPALNETVSNAYYQMGYVYNRNKNYTEAISAFDKSIDVNPNNTNSYYGKGNSLKALGKNVEAIELYRKAVEINPLNYRAYINMGTSYHTLEQLDKALEAFKNAANASENVNQPSEQAFAYWGRTLYEQQKYQEALIPLRKSISIKPNWTAYYYSAEAFYRLGGYDEAIANAEDCLKLKRGYGGAYIVIGRSYKKKGSKVKALENFNFAMRDRNWRDTARYEIELMEKGLD